MVGIPSQRFVYFTLTPISFSLLFFIIYSLYVYFPLRSICFDLFIYNKCDANRSIYHPYSLEKKVFIIHSKKKKKFISISISNSLKLCSIQSSKYLNINESFQLYCDIYIFRRWQFSLIFSSCQRTTSKSHIKKIKK